jgi:hypothetical protein
VSSTAAGTPTLYHLADVRLGGAFPFLGRAGTGHRRQVRETFVHAVDRGLALAPSLVIISGNLFGTPFPARDVVDFAREQVRRFASSGIPVLVAAGPLDPLYDGSYAAGALDDLGQVTIFPAVAFPAAAAPVEFPDLDLCVVGASWSASPSQPVHADFLDALAPRGRLWHLVGAAHIELPATGDALAALARRIGACGASYLALGGSPVRRDLSAGRVAAWCPGAPEMVAPDPAEGSPLLVTLGDPPVAAPQPVARRRFARFTLEPSAYASADELCEAIRALADPALAASVRLAGASRINQFIDVDDLQRRLADEFLALEIEDESAPSLEGAAAAYPEMSVAGKLVGVAAAETARAATPEARWRSGAALRLGLSLLEGRRPP